MNSLTIIAIIFGITCGAVVCCAYYLKRILNILRMAYNGEPTQEDINNMYFSQMRPKE